MKTRQQHQESFEQALKRLEQIVQRLESGELALEESLSLFEEGIRLSRICTHRLDEAEKRITLLTRGEDGQCHVQVADPDDFLRRESGSEGDRET